MFFFFEERAHLTISTLNTALDKRTSNAATIFALRSFNCYSCLVAVEPGIWFG